MVSCGRKTVTDKLKANEQETFHLIVLSKKKKKKEQLSSNTFGKFQGKLHMQSQIECTLQMAAPTSLAPRRQSANRKHHCKLNCKASYLVFKSGNIFRLTLLFIFLLSYGNPGIRAMFLFARNIKGIRDLLSHTSPKTTELGWELGCPSICLRVVPLFDNSHRATVDDLVPTTGIWCEMSLKWW